MAFINITTNNLSRELRSNKTYEDNWVFVPGTAITGSGDGYYLFTSLTDFQNTCGTSSPEGSITYEYVAGVLSAGLPVIFKRITTNDIDPSNVASVVKAQTNLSHTNSAEEEIIDAVVYEKYGGTYGNSLSVSVRNTGTAYYIDVYQNSITLLESHKLISYNSASESQVEINTKLIEALQATEFERIDIDVQITEPEEFSLQTVTKKALTGGADLDESLVPAMIPSVYAGLTDKILYKPLFLTSGGYTDDNYSSETPIADAMKDLSLERQDCRALIDLPSNLAKEEQQEVASLMSYTQTSNTAEIPSASICAPWVYMQVGNSQLWMPPSYAYLMVVGDCLSRGGNVYTPKAGLSNGVVPNIIKPQFEIGSDIMEQWQTDGEVQLNPIMKIQSNNYIIAGNSTLLVTDISGDEENAFSESSADLTVLTIRRQVYNAAAELQYQYNSATAFENFSIRVAKELDAMQTEGSIYDYQITNISTNDEPRKLKVRLDVYLTPTIKYIEINLNISYGNVEMSTGGES